MPHGSEGQFPCHYSRSYVCCPGWIRCSRDWLLVPELVVLAPETGVLVLETEQFRSRRLLALRSVIARAEVVVALVLSCLPRYASGPLSRLELARAALPPLLPSEQSNLITLGAELDDDFAFIYQEWHPEALPETFPAINNGLLIDLIPEAQQFTRIETPKGIEERRR